MRINEISVDPELVTFEQLVFVQAQKIEQLYQGLSISSNQFSVPAHSILPEDSIQELISYLDSAIGHIHLNQLNVSQTLQIATALLQYLDA